MFRARNSNAQARNARKTRRTRQLRRAATRGLARFSCNESELAHGLLPRRAATLVPGMAGTRRKGFRLTTERKAVLERLVRYRFLRTSHFYEFCGAGRSVSERAVRRLLHDLLAHGFLRRRVVMSEVARDPFPRYENVYWLSRAGVVLARECGLCDEDVPAASGASLVMLQHDVAISDFHIGVERFCRERGWLLHWRQHGLRRGVNPDALFALTDPSRPAEENTSYYFLEVERSGEGGYREGRSVLLRRLDGYADYQGSEACRSDWEWFEEFRVVIVVASEVRRRNLLARLSEEFPLPIFWVAVAGSDVTGPAFWTPADEERAYSFLD